MMPNIMLTYRCNLRCPYCFANEFVNKEKTDISLTNFSKAVSFITRTEPFIGLIGGEPTLHPGFQTFLEMLIMNPRVTGVRVFTNGILLDSFIPQLTHPKMEICVNCNSPENMGEEAFAHMRNNLDILMGMKDVKDRVKLGFNLYSDEMDYTYMMELLQRYDQHTVRTSLTVPDFSVCGDADAPEEFRKRKKFLLEFYRKMDSIGVLPFSDCNHPPYCIWTDEEKQWLEAFVARHTTRESKLVGDHSRCSPVIDILPDLRAVRCFGMSDFMKVPIDAFRNIPDICDYFMTEIDSVAYKLPAREECKNCRNWQLRHCLAGCIGYKSARIRACNEAIAKI